MKQLLTFKKRTDAIRHALSLRDDENSWVNMHNLHMHERKVMYKGETVFVIEYLTKGQLNSVGYMQTDGTSYDSSKHFKVIQ